MVGGSYAGIPLKGHVNETRSTDFKNAIPKDLFKNHF